MSTYNYLSNKLYSVYYYFIKYLFYKLLFKHFGKRTKIYSILRLENPKNIFIGNHITIGYSIWLAATPHTEKTPKLEIKDGCSIGNFNEFYCINEVIIEEKVLTADNVYISDNSHNYFNIELPILEQFVIETSSVKIGEGTWLGRNVCVLGANVGKHCVIGANSVVNKSIPDYCVAAGVPAKILKRYDFETKKWKKTDSNGIFIDE